MRLLSIVFTVAIAISLAACSKSKGGCTATTPADDDKKMLAYISANGITATKHSSGMYYQIITPGTGATPTATSTVTAAYTGKFTDNTVFDSSPSASFPLNGVIAGWQIGLPLIQKGGKIKLIIPPYLAYGADGAGRLPCNSILFFDVELLDVK
jgi:FKBP-type peptidyl-prolyl cis-trans isomerase FkpA